MKVIPWSGGADSTLLLAHTLRKNPVRALTLVHPQLIKKQEEREKRARAQFKKWLPREIRMRFDHHTITVKTKAEVHNNVGQPGLWLCHLMPYVRSGDDLLFAYIRGDDFWHLRHLFTAAFTAIACNHYLSADTHVSFPFEWNTKADVIRGLKRYRIPRRCWWTCDHPKKGACGRCNKCVQFRRAMEDIKAGRFSNEIPIEPSPTKMKKKAT